MAAVASAVIVAASAAARRVSSRLRPAEPGACRLVLDSLQAVHYGPIPGRSPCPGWTALGSMEGVSEGLDDALRRVPTTLEARKKPVATNVPLVEGAWRAIAAPTAGKQFRGLRLLMAASTSSSVWAAADMVIPRSPSPAKPSRWFSRPRACHAPAATASKLQSPGSHGSPAAPIGLIVHLRPTNRTRKASRSRPARRPGATATQDAAAISSDVAYSPTTSAWADNGRNPGFPHDRKSMYSPLLPAR